MLYLDSRTPLMALRRIKAPVARNGAVNAFGREVNRVDP